MSVLGLYVMKKLCAFVAYGNKITCQVQYQGNIALAKRFGSLKKVPANVIYEDDIFEYGIDPETGEMKILKHETKIENIDPS
jgi:recombination protein RecT